MINSTHRFSFHYWCTQDVEVFDFNSDPWELENLAGTANGTMVVREYTPIAAALGRCTGKGCREPVASMATTNVPLLPCYEVYTGPKCQLTSTCSYNPTGALIGVRVEGRHLAGGGWFCAPDPLGVCQPGDTWMVSISVDGRERARLRANASRADPPDEGRAHGFELQGGSISLSKGKHVVAAYGITGPGAREKTQRWELLGSPVTVDVRNHDLQGRWSV